MIPIKLILQGINSYQEAQEIDFSRLAKAGLFGIFGKVGAGKSTILDAISYALFEKTERLDHTGKNYNLTNLRSKHLLVDYECCIGEKNYRFVVKGRRNSNVFEKVEIRRSILVKNEAEEWQPIATTTEALTGISYDNFKRMVIIPQGRFQEFLELGDDARTRMLMDLFRLERFDLSDRVGVLATRNREALSVLNTRLEALGEATTEALQTRQDELKANQTDLKVREEDCKTLVGQEQAAEVLRLKLDELKAAETAYEILAAQQQDHERRERQLTEFEYATRHFKSLFDQQKDAQDDLARDTQALAGETQKFDTETNQLSADCTQLESLRPGYEARETLLKRAAELRILREVRQLTDALECQAGRIKKGETLLAEKKTELDGLRADRDARAKNIKVQKQQLPDIKKLTDIKKWYSEKEKFLKEKQQILREGKQKAEVAKSSYENNLLLPKVNSIRAPFPPFHERRPYAEWETIFIEGRNQFNVLIRQVEAEKIHLSNQYALQRYATELVLGEPCPLCQSMHHDGPVHHLTDFPAKIDELTDQMQVLEEQRESLTQVQTHLQGFDTEKVRFRKEWDRTETSLKTHLTTFIWIGEFHPDEPDAVEEAITAASALQVIIADAEEALETLDKCIRATEEGIREKFEAPLKLLRDKQLGDEATRTEKRRQLTLLAEADFAESSPEMLDAQAARLEAEHQTLTNTFKDLQKTIQQKEIEHGSRRGVVKTLGEQVKKLGEKLVTLAADLALILQKSTFPSLEAAGLVLEQSIDPEAERKAIDGFRTELAKVVSNCTRLQAETSGQPYDAEQHAAVKIQIEAIQRGIDRLKDEAGKLGNQIEQIQKQLESRTDLLRQKDALDVRQADLATLTRLFKASGFVNYVSAVYLQNLCNAANERFTLMTRQQFRLEVYESKPSTYDFRIRDLLNEGKTRSVGSLSGGQKFQASLALALALSDTQPFFFLDEGFGSLDKESLTVVFDTLRSLRKENRVVGIISHVEELQQEIDCYLHVTHHEEHGSRVRGSWEV